MMLVIKSCIFTAMYIEYITDKCNRLRDLFPSSSVPNNGIVNVRIHWLLDLIDVDDHGRLLETGHLDRLVHLLWMHDLTPGLEIMGNPSGYFKDFYNMTQVRMKHSISRGHTIF